MLTHHWCYVPEDIVVYYIFFFNLVEFLQSILIDNYNLDYNSL